MARLETLRTTLATVEGKIAEHPYRSADVLAAHELIESASPNPSATRKDKDALSAELLAKGLPTLEKLGLITAKGLFSWGKLHRSQKKLQRRIAKLESRASSSGGPTKVS
jgi:hypothetical protein